MGNPVRLAGTDSNKVSRTVSYLRQKLQPTTLTVICGKGCPRLINRANQGGESGLYSVSKPLSAPAETRTLDPSLQDLECVDGFPLVF
jgi:hypothetical protein